MYVVKDKVILDMIKTAGTSIFTSLYASGIKIDVNMKHLNIDYLPSKYRELPRYAVIREPHKWYESFYKFFYNVEGFMSFMISDPKDDGYIYPIGLNKFIGRAMNLKDTLIKYPNKARVFSNILQTQGKLHFINSYFKVPLVPGDLSTYEQFDMSLYEWFWRGAGYHTAPIENFIRMDELHIVEELLGVKVPVSNVTKNEINETISEKSMELIKTADKVFYDIYNRENIKGKIIALLGKSGAGKTTIAKKIKSAYNNVVLIDGDELRAETKNSGLDTSSRGANINLGYSRARKLADKGKTVIIAMQAPLKDIRNNYLTDTDLKFIVTNGGDNIKDTLGYNKNFDPDYSDVEKHLELTTFNVDEFITRYIDTKF
jgi:chloramphenicol 3-O-phosphotransferase